MLLSVLNVIAKHAQAQPVEERSVADEPLVLADSNEDEQQRLNPQQLRPYSNDYEYQQHRQQEQQQQRNLLPWAKARRLTTQVLHRSRLRGNREPSRTRWKRRAEIGSISQPCRPIAIPCWVNGPVLRRAVAIRRTRSVS